MDINNEQEISKICDWLKDQPEYKDCPITLMPSPFYHIAPQTYAKFIQRYVAALQPSTLPVKSDNECKSIWHNHHVRMSHFCTLCGGATLIEKNEPSTLPLIEKDWFDKWQKFRTDAISTMFNCVDKTTGIYPTSYFFEMLDDYVKKLIQSVPLIDKGSEETFTKLCEEGINIMWRLLPAHKYKDNKDAGRLWEILETIKTQNNDTNTR